MATVTRGLIQRGDLALYDGKNFTSSRPDATGGTRTGLRVGNTVDVLQVYGDGENRTRGTVANAVQRIGSTSVALQFSPGTWTIDDDLTIPSNFVCHLPHGCIFDISSGKTLTFSGPVIAEDDTHQSGSGTLVGLDTGGLRNAFYRATAAETAAGVTLANFQYRPGETRRYTNGLADALLVAVESTAAEEKDILVTEDQSISTGISFSGPTTTFASRGISVRASPGAVITYTGTGVAVTIGSSSETTRNVTWDVPIIRSSQNWDDGTDTTSVGLRLIRVDRSTIVANIEGFNVGLNLRGTGGGNVHNDIRIYEILDNRIGILLDRDGTLGWNNSNFFHSGIITYRSGTMDNACDNNINFWCIDLDDQSDNEGTFIGIALEVAAGSAKTATADSGIITCNGSFHSFLKCRIETNNVTLSQYVRWETSAQFNVFDCGRAPTATTFANFVDDSATQSTNSVFNFGNLIRYGDTRGVVAGVLRGTGNPSSAQFVDGTFDANVVAGPNTSSNANKVFAARGGATSGTSGVVGGITGTGRSGIGKDPDVSYGHDQLIHATASGRFDNESVNRTTFHKSTIDDTPNVVNVDDINPPEGAGTWLVMKVVCFDDQSQVGLARIRAAFIQRIGTGNLAINNQANLYNAADGGPPDAVFSVSGTQINVTLTGISGRNLRWSGTLEWQHASVDEAFP